MRLTWQVHKMHAQNRVWLRGNQAGEMSYALEPMMHIRGRGYVEVECT